MTQANPVVYRGGGILGAFRGFQNDSLGFVDSMMVECGDVAELHLGPIRALFLRRPEHIEHVLIRNAKNYRKDTRGYRMMKKVLGLGLVTSQDDFWRRQRRIAQPAFTKKRVAGFAESMTRATDRLLTDRFQDAADNGEVIDVNEAMMRLTLEIVSETMLSITSGVQSDEVAAALPVVLEHMIYRTTHVLSVHESLPLKRNRKFRAALGVLDDVVWGIIRQRRQATESSDDLLAMLMETRDADTGETMTDQHLRDEVMTMYLAGHETTAVALGWTFYLLSQNPEWEQRVFEELDELLDGRSATIDDLPKFDVVKRVIQESMRLYPPVWIIGRHAVADDDAGDLRIKKGRIVFVSPWATHRDEKLWPDPLRFDPDRFLPENVSPRHKLSYFPFSAGQRKCIGDHFAMMEAMLIFSTVLSKYRLSLVPGQTIVPNPTITLRPKHGVKMNVHRR